MYAAPLERFAGLRVLLRLQAPRHPPRTLSSLFSFCLLFSSVSTRADLFAFSKIEAISYLVGKVPIGFDPNRWRVETSLKLSCASLCPVRLTGETL